MSRFWSPFVRDLEPYVPGEQPKMARLGKLNTNEHPLGPSPRVIEAIRAAADDRLRLYPDPDATELKDAIAAYHGVSRAQVFVGNGSDEVLAHIFFGLFKQDRPLLFPDITYSFYKVYCGLYDIDYRPVPLDDDLAIDPADYTAPNGGIIFPNPNAPTGRLLPLDAIEAVLAANPESVVVIDEAYVDFGGDSAIALVDRYPNLLVTQTLSKSRSLAGVRIGFAVGHPELIDGLERIKNSFNSYPLDRLAIAAGKAAFEDEDFFQRGRELVIEERETLRHALETMHFQVLPSAANFLFCRHATRPGADLAAALRERGIIVRHFGKPERIQDHLRITVGRPDQNRELTEALEEILSS